MRRGTRREIKSSRHRIKNALPTLFLSLTAPAELGWVGAIAMAMAGWMGARQICRLRARICSASKTSERCSGARDAVAVQKGQKADNNFLLKATGMPPTSLPKVHWKGREISRMQICFVNYCFFLVSILRLYEIIGKN